MRLAQCIVLPIPRRQPIPRSTLPILVAASHVCAHSIFRLSFNIFITQTLILFYMYNGNKGLFCSILQIKCLTLFHVVKILILVIIQVYNVFQHSFIVCPIQREEYFLNVFIQKHRSHNSKNGKYVAVSAIDAFTWKNMGNTTKMVKSCCVIDCTNRFSKNSGRSCFVFSPGCERVTRGVWRGRM